MTRLASSPLSRPTEVDPSETRSRFLLARAQASSHARTADYLRVRDATLAESAASAENTRTA